MKNIKWIGISLAATVLLSLASCNTTPPTPDQQPSSEVTVETKAKYINPHFENGNLTNKLHYLDLDLYYYIIDYIIDRGGEPNSRNIDAVYHAMGH